MEAAKLSLSTAPVVAEVAAHLAANDLEVRCLVESVVADAVRHVDAILELAGVPAAQPAAALRGCRLLARLNGDLGDPAAGARESVEVAGAHATTGLGDDRRRVDVADRSG